MGGMIKILELLPGIKVKIHSSGEIETLNHTKVRKNGRVDNRKGRVLKQKLNRYGYYEITLSSGEIRKTCLVHRLVAKAFIENHNGKPTVNHIDGNKRNNSVDNLEWATHKEQRKHAIETGLAKNNVIALEVANKRKARQVLFCGKLYKSINEAAKLNNVHERVVRSEGVMQNERHY